LIQPEEAGPGNGVSLPDADGRVLEEMLRHIERLPEPLQPSAFWRHFIEKNLDQLRRCGLSEFKRTINQNYFNWVPRASDNNQFRRLAALWAERPSLVPFEVEIEAPETLEGFFDTNPMHQPERLALYRAFVALLWHHACETDPDGLTQRLEEPELGNPIRTTLRGRRISQDLANSARERAAVLPYLPAGKPTVCEIGAGYGRLPYVFLTAGPVRYVIVDLPPALFVSQWYLTQLFPERRTLTFSPWTDFEEVRERFEAADLVFLTPDQLARTGDGWADACVTISTLGEMLPAQIDWYRAEMARVSRGVVYIKQWLRTENALDGLILTKADYDMPASFEAVLDRPDPVHDQFFETVWRRRAASAA
jgi:putative sugar O-methyltransferase